MAYNFQSIDYGSGINNAYNQQMNKVNPWGQAIKDVGRIIGNFGDKVDTWETQKRQWDEMKAQREAEAAHTAEREAIQDARYEDERDYRARQDRINYNRQVEQDRIAEEERQYQRAQNRIANDRYDRQLNLQEAQLQQQAMKEVQEKNLENQMAIDLKDFNDADWGDAELGGKILGMNFDPTVDNDAKSINEMQKMLGIKPAGVWGRESQEKYDQYAMANKKYLDSLNGLYDKYGAANVIKSMDDAKREKMFEALMQKNKQAATPAPTFVF